MTDTLIDAVIRIKNGYAARQETVALRYSRMTEKVISLLAQEQYLKGYRIDSKEGKVKILANLLYPEGEPAVRGIQLISKPGRRIYSGAREIPPVLGGAGIAVVTTPKGIMTDRAARKQKAGGEVLFKIW